MSSTPSASRRSASTGQAAGGPLGRSYGILSQLAPLILKHQTTGDVAGVVLQSITPSQRIRLGDYES